MKQSDQSPTPHGRLWLLGALAAVVAPQLLRMPPALDAICLLLLAWRLTMELRGWPPPARTPRLLLTAAGVAAVLATYHSLFGRDAGLALLTVMLCLKPLELRTQRDAMVTILIGYFMVAGGFLFSQSLFTGAYLFAVVWVLTAAMMALNHPGPPAGRLYLRRSGVLLLQGLPIMLLLFVLFPRIDGPLWGLPRDAFAGRTGLSNHMTLANITDLADSDAVAFRVQFAGSIPPADKLYWRGPVFWVTDGRRWDPLPQAQRDNWYRRPRPLATSGDAVRYTLTLEPDNKRWLFALDLPAAAPAGARMTADYQLRLARDLQQRQRFTLRSYLRYRATGITPKERALALQLPPHANPRTRALAATWRGHSDTAIVQEALRYFRDQPFYYTRHPPPLGANAIDEFLFVTRRGFCEHYAAAFTTLMRAAGIPARVVTGYQGGEVNPIGGYLIVRQRLAHAWSEVYLNGRGWVRVDPTAVIPPQRVDTTADAERFRTTAPIAAANIELAWLARLRDGWDALNNTWNQWVLGYDSSRQQRVLQALGLLAFGWSGVIAALTAAIASILAAIALYSLRRTEKTGDPSLRLYRRLERRLARRGFRRAAHEGPQAFAERIGRRRPDVAPTLRATTYLYLRLRYGYGGANELEQFRRAVATFRLPRQRR